MVKNLIQSKKHLINAGLAIIAIGVIVFYAICGGSCSYLKGHIFGLDLKYVGIVLMVAIGVLSIMKKQLLLLMILSASIGVEIFLFLFQVRQEVYCPFCIVFGIILVILFLLNADLNKKWVTLLFIVLGFLLFHFFFKGTVSATYTVMLG